MANVDPDILIALGVFLLVLSVPSLISAVIDRRPPRVAALTAIIAAGILVYTVQTNPGIYSLRDVPDVFIRVAARFI
ncbi:MAG: hypothetical protein AAF231_09790 [Pseudomonadota bacterium]